MFFLLHFLGLRFCALDDFEIIRQNIPQETYLLSEIVWIVQLRDILNFWTWNVNIFHFCLYAHNHFNYAATFTCLYHVYCGEVIKEIKETCIPFDKIETLNVKAALTCNNFITVHSAFVKYCVLTYTLSFSRGSHWYKL